jgi:hypothetical protein
MARGTVRVELDLELGSEGATRVLVRGPVFRGKSSRSSSGSPYLYASVQPVHVYRCRAVHYDQRHGPCDCGAQELYARWLGSLKKK